MNEAPYTIDDLGLEPKYGKKPPSFGNTFEDGPVSALGAGEMIGNTVMQDGHLRSSNFEEGVAGWRLTDTSAELNVSTALASLDIPDTVTADSFHVDNEGNAWWGATAIGSAVAKILKSGIATFTNIVITGGSVSGTPISSIPNNSSTDISLLDLTHDLAFSSSDSDTVAWGSGTITLSNGRTFSISAGNTGNMAALTYIYLSPADSSTVLQTTTTATTAMGANKKLIGIAQNQTDGAIFQVHGGKGGVAIHPDSVITAQLSAIAADLGAIIAGTVVLPSSGYVRSGQTAFNTGTGFFLGNDSGTPKFSIGNPSGNRLTWDGTTLTVVGQVTDVQTFNADGTWTKPGFGSVAFIQVWGAGGSGARDDTRDCGGGAGGAYIEAFVPLALLGATESVTVGVGGAARSSNQAGAAGGNSSFGTWATAYGGAGGGYDAANPAGGGGGGGPVGAGAVGSGTNLGGAGGGLLGGAGGNGATPGGDSTDGGGGGGGSSGDGGSSIRGGGGGGGSASSGGNSLYGGAGGRGKGGGSPGTSKFGGNGGAINAAGSAPGGGGGASATTSGAGGNGRVIVTVF